MKCSNQSVMNGFNQEIVLPVFLVIMDIDDEALGPKARGYIVTIFTHLKLCLAAAIHNRKLV